MKCFDLPDVDLPGATNSGSCHYVDGLVCYLSLFVGLHRQHLDTASILLNFGYFPLDAIIFTTIYPNSRRGQAWLLNEDRKRGRHGRALCFHGSGLRPSPFRGSAYLYLLHTKNLTASRGYNIVA